MAANMDATVGALLTATCLSCWTCGIVVSLAARYRTKFHNDRPWIRIAVAVATLWALVDTAINCTWMYKWCVTYFTNPAGLLEMPWELTAYCVVMSTAVCLVQFFYLYRIYAVSKNRIFVALFGALCLGCYGIALYMCYYCSRSSDIAAFADIRNVSWGWFGGVLFIDLCITVAMFYYLVQRPKKLSGGATSTSSPLKMVVRNAVQSNALSAICQACIVVLYAKYPTSFYYTYFGLMEVKIYIGSFLATLNARNPHGDGAFETTISGDGRTKGFGAHSQQPVHVSVRQEIAIDADEDDSFAGEKHGSFPSKGGLAGAAATPYRVQFERGPEVEKGGKGGIEQHEMGEF
ncbi:hypothetical protein JCM6882_004346 [Rhodosporidiobolus microsporus]